MPLQPVEEKVSVETGTAPLGGCQKGGLGLMKRIVLTALTVAMTGIWLVLGAVSFAGEKPAPAPVAQKKVEELAAYPFKQGLVSEAQIKGLLYNIYGEFLIYKKHKRHIPSGFYDVDVIMKDAPDEPLPAMFWVSPDGKFLLEGLIYDMYGEQIGRKVAGEELKQSKTQPVSAELKRNELGEVVGLATPSIGMENPLLENINTGEKPGEMFRKIVAEEVNSSNIRPTFPEDFMDQSLIETSALILNPTGEKGVINVFIDIDCPSCVAAVEDITRTKNSDNSDESGVKLRLVPVLLDPAAGTTDDRISSHLVRSAYFLHTKGKFLPKENSITDKDALKNSMRAIRLNTEFLKASIAPAPFSVPIVTWESSTGTDGMYGWPSGHLKQLLSTASQKKV